MSRNLLILLLAASLATAAQAASSPADLRKAAESLDAASREQLGIGVRSVSLLLQASPSSFHLVQGLQQDESWLLLNDLEAKGFVTLILVAGPDGQLVGIRLTPTGAAVVEALSAP
jgi:hypothetical protein